MKIRMCDGRELKGTAVEIVQAMPLLAFGVENLTLAEYIGWVVDNARKFEGVTLEAKGASDEDLAASLVDVMVRAGLAERV